MSELALYRTGSQCVDELFMRDGQCTYPHQVRVAGLSRSKRNSAAASNGRIRAVRTNKVPLKLLTSPPACSIYTLQLGASHNTRPTSTFSLSALDTQRTEDPAIGAWRHAHTVTVQCVRRRQPQMVRPGSENGCQRPIHLQRRQTGRPVHRPPSGRRERRKLHTLH